MKRYLTLGLSFGLAATLTVQADEQLPVFEVDGNVYTNVTSRGWNGC